MGNYNPHSPYILGQEWVPIRDENLVYSPGVNAFELGTTYVQAASQRVRDARFYAHQLPPAFASSQCGLVNIYPAGLEDQTGPLRELVIPSNSAAIISGSNIVNFGGSSIIEVVAQPSDGKYLEFDYNSGTPQRVELFFAVDAYPELANKRILNVSLLYSGYVNDQDPVTGVPIDFVNPTPATVLSLIQQRDNAGVNMPFTSPGSGALSNTGTLAALATTVNNASHSAIGAATLAALDLGDVNNFWDPTLNPQSTTDRTRMPWRYVDLQRFESTAANRQRIFLQMQVPSTAATAAGFTTTPSVFIDYLALRVIYCEEKRVAYGAKLFTYAYGMNSVNLRDTSFNADPVLAASTYLPTLSWVSPGTINFGQSINGQFPDLNALRELYTIPSHLGTQVNVPFPLEDRIGSVFSSEFTHILPQLTLHASGGTLTEPHVYGRQAAAQVYGANVATQDIYDDISGVAADYPQVRFYARRFGDTTIPLTLAGADPAGMFLPGVAGSYASTPDNAALDIVGDIDLRVDLAHDTWRPAAAEILIGKFTSAGNQRSYLMYLNTAGTLQFVSSADGTAFAVNVASTVAVPIASGRLTVRATLDVDNGAAGNTVTFYTGTGGIGGAFTQLGAPVVTAGVTSIFNSTAVLEVGSFDAGASNPLSGTVVAAEVRNGIAGVAVANPDFGAQAPGTTVFVDAAGRTWTLNGTAAIVAGNSASTASITVADFDALVEILDGWREITLRFATAPSMGAQAGTPGWTWSATAETSGNRWEILAASAPAISGIPGNIYNLVPSPNQLGTATYQPPSGETVELSWMPHGIASPWVTGTTADPATDAVLIFSQDPPTVTGVGLTARTQVVTGVGLDCGSLPCCIPTGIAYQEITWSATTLPATGFGAYELQRFDTLGSDFETIMLATDSTLVSFNDFEARVGITSVYRIRSLNALNFAGQWSTYVSGAPPAPGITGGCSDSTGALIFTSNADQSGTNNAAYVMQWEGTPTEDFSLPEADIVTYQPMYGRDGSVAFHGTERGLEAFNRTVLLHAAAISPIRLADAATIRDLAWADLPYVCVRDDIGDRWYSSVRVPSVNARLDRTKYMARLEIVETTVCPYPVDP